MVAPDTPREPLTQAQIQRLTAATLACVLGAGTILPAQAASIPGAAPSSGTVLKRSAPPPRLPVPPQAVPSLPSPATQGPESSIEIPVKKIVIQGNTLVATPKLQARVASLVGRTVTLTQLKNKIASITNYYHELGYTLSYAYIPAQTVANGVIKIGVIETRYDQIDITGDARLDHGQVKRTIVVKPGDPVAQRALNRSLLLMHRTPGVRVAGTMVPGRKTGTSTLKLELHDGPWLQGGVAGDDYGSKSTGRYRTRAHVTLNDPLGLGSRLSVNGLTTESGLLHSAGGRLLSPNIWHGLRLVAYGSHTEYELGDQFAALNLHGIADQFGLDLRYPLVLQPGRLLQLSAGWQRENFRQYSKQLNFNKRSHIRLLHLRLSGVYADHTGGTTSASVGLRRGEQNLDNATARQADAAGPKTLGNFWVGQFRVGHTQPLPARLDLELTLNGQWASTNLDGSEKIYLGGPYGVKSAPVGDAGGDSGVLASVRLARPLPLPAKAGHLTAALEAQAGTVWINHTRPPGFTGTNRIQRYGVGAALEYQWRQYLSASVSYSHALGSPAKQSETADDNQVWASVRIGF